MAKILEAVRLNKPHVDAVKCGALKANSMKCTRDALFYVAKQNLCAEHFGLFQIEKKKEGVEVRIV